MAVRKRRNSRGVLEWVTETAYETVELGNNLTVIDLDLNPDEVAEIYKIESSIYIDLSTYAATLFAQAGILLSTDPSSAVTPIPDGSAAEVDDWEDEEVFYTHRNIVDVMEAGTAASALLYNLELSEKSEDYNFPAPLLVGRNIGMTTSFEEQNANDVTEVSYMCRVWFRRRKGAPNEILNLIKH